HSARARSFDRPRARMHRADDESVRCLSGGQDRRRRRHPVALQPPRSVRRMTMKRYLFAIAITFAGCQSGETLPDDPSSTLPPDHEHGFDMHWATVGSFSELSASSDVVARGHIVSVQDAALRVFPWSQELGRELTGAESNGVHDDTYVKLYTLQVDEIVGVAAGSVDVTGAPVAVGSRIEVAELGGKI